MKYLLALLVIPLFFNCSQNKESETKNIRFSQLDTLKKFGGINGDWMLFKIKGNGVETTFPSSYKVKFNESNGSAVVIKPGMEEFFGWQFNGNLIQIQNKNKNPDSVTFSDSAYVMAFTFSSESVELELKSENGWYSYILRRELVK